MVRIIKSEQYVWASLRIALGLIFLWAFIDKLFGLGFSTAPENSWLLGVSPTKGFLAAGVHGPFAPLYHTLAGSLIVDWLFMLGLLLIGVALIAGIGTRVAGYSGALLMFLMWTALLPPEHHLFIDEHLVYLIVLLGIAQGHAGRCLGLGRWWENVVKRHKWLI